MTMEPSPRQLRSEGAHTAPGPPVGEMASEGKKRIVDLLYLLADGREWPAKQLAAVLNVTVRTIHRDMDLLEQKGLVIRKPGRNGGYRMLPDSFARQPRMLPREVITLLILAMRESLRPQGSNVALQGLAKIIDLQPHATRRPLQELMQCSSADPAATAWLFRQEWLGVLLEGLVDTRPLRIHLCECASAEGCDSLELVPDSLQHSQGGWFLKAHQVWAGQGQVIELDLGNLSSISFGTPSA